MNCLFTCTTVLFDNLSPGFLWSSCLGPLASYSMHFFTQSSSSSCTTCPYHCSLFCCHTDAMSSIPNLSLSSLFGNLSFSLTPHIHLTILISARWSATSFSFLTDQCKWRKWLNKFKKHEQRTTHTHTRLTALCPGLPRWAGTRKVKPV